MRRRWFESGPVLLILDNSAHVLGAHDVAAAYCLAMAEVRVRLPLGALCLRMWESLALAPPPFDHTKLMLVDELRTLLGSTNWDPRSLRLNFEFNVECYDRKLATSLTDLVRSKIQPSRPLSLADMDGRSLPIRLRDGVARLCAPYL